MTLFRHRVRFFLSLVLATAALGQDFYTEPTSVAQGQVLKVYSRVPAHAVRFNGLTVPVYTQAAVETLGLVPVDVLAKPGTYALDWLNENGESIHQSQIAIRDAHYAKQNVVLSKALSELHSTSDEREIVSRFLQEEMPQRYWAEPLQAPIHGCITSPFGVTRLHNGTPTGEYHAGLDQRGAMGSPIHAVTGGMVRIVQKFELHGGTVAIDHGQGLESMYLHMSAFGVKEGDLVKPGDVIGYVGSTGRSTGPHLHWSLYVHGEPVSPQQWISGLIGCGAAPRPQAKAKKPRS